jgi:alpha-galactosidase
MKTIVFVGAGSIVFTKRLLNDLFSYYPDLKDTFTIRLVDIDDERLQIAAKMVQMIKNEKGSKSKIEMYKELAPALKDATYVINTVQIGGNEVVHTDLDIPEKYGLKQTIADTHGVGGIMRFLRTAPFLQELVSTIERECPDALLLNFTNPMSMCMWYINSISKIKNIGLCHSIPATLELISEYIKVQLKDIDYEVAGINHMAWVLKLEKNGEDLYPLLFKAMEDKTIWERDPVRFELLRRFSYFVTESSEHNAEYVPYFMKDQRLIEKLRIPVREIAARIELNEKIYQTYKKYYLEGDKSMKDEDDRMKAKYFGKKNNDQINHLEEDKPHEYAMQIIDAIEEKKTVEFYGIVPNHGSITNFPYNCEVEIPCIADRNGIHSTFVGELPPQLAALNISQIKTQDLAVRAAITKKKEYVYYAMLLDPLAASILSMDEINDMTKELIDASVSYLNYLS